MMRKLDTELPVTNEWHNRRVDAAIAELEAGEAVCEGWADMSYDWKLAVVAFNHGVEIGDIRERVWEKTFSRQF